MNKWIASVLALAVVSPVILVGLDAMGVGPGFHVEAPTWSSGHHWDYTYVGTGSASGSIPGLASGSTDTLRIEGVRRAEVLNTTATMGDELAYAVLEALRIDAVKYGDKDLLADAYQNMPDADISELSDPFLCLTPCGTLLAFHGHTDLQYLLPGDLIPEGGTSAITPLDFPLTRGKTWDVVSFPAPVEGVTVTVRAEAMEEEYIDVPGLKPVQAIRVEAALTDASRDAIRDAVRAAAQHEDIDLQMDFSIRFTYWYAAKVENIVKMDMDSYIAGRVAGFGAAATFRADLGLTQTLSDYSLQEKPERSLEAAYALANAAINAPEPLRPIAREAWDFHLAATATSVEAGAGDTIQIGTVRGAGGQDEATAFDSPPSGNTVSWTHRFHHDGAPVVETLQGDTVTVSLDQPGLHVFSARVLDASGAVVGADDIVIEAYSHDITTVDGPAAVSVLMGESVAHVLRVAPGASTATLVLTPDALSAGSLSLTAPSGEEDVVFEGEIHETQTFERESPASGDWHVQWATDARVGGLTIDVTVRYDRAATAAAGDASSGGAGFPDFAALAAAFVAAV